MRVFFTQIKFFKCSKKVHISSKMKYVLNVKSNYIQEQQI